MSGILPVIPLSGIISETVELTGGISDTDEGITGSISDDMLAANKYTGPYTVIPRKVGQTLETSDKFMVHDVEIDPINYSEVSNPSGGFTVNIGYE